jgi:tRNA-dependent cyclodipeptide synthase
MKAIVEPRDRRDEALASSKCVYSVSLSTDESRYQRMLRGYQWTLSRFEDITIYLGDGPLLQTTLEVLGRPHEQAVREAAEIAEKTRANLDEIVAASGALDRGVKVSYLCASQLEANREFEPIRETLLQAYNRDAAIRSSIDADAESYVARLHFRNRLGMDRSLAHAKAVQYLIFEIAGYVMLANAGRTVDVYASGSGELPTLQRFMAGELTGFEALSARACIVLKS